MSNQAKFVEIVAPTAWASALVNGDLSGLEDREVEALENWLYVERRKTDSELFYCVGCADDYRIERTPRGTLYEAATYTFQVQP